ncbi:MAG: GNAT family N-acetyltransferase [Anaerolineae bacterium]|nr:GNAT family N-acetyltransferase [Anaerolineae bacterium]
MPDWVARPLEYLRDEDLGPLLAESLAQGYCFVQTLRDEYADGRNRFDQPGAVLLGIFDGQRIIAVGGLHPDPYLERPDVGRIRHVYVLDAYRRSGVGRALMAALIDHARRHFNLLTLRTLSADASAFYVALDFAVTDAIPHATHVMHLKP